MDLTTIKYDLISKIGIDLDRNRRLKKFYKNKKYRTYIVDPLAELYPVTFGLLEVDHLFEKLGV